ncbi:MAG: LVIVD repeat-containing protein [Haloechinothrix sp.]
MRGTLKGRWRPRATFAAVGTIAAVLCSALGASGAAAQSESPGVDEIVSSRNMKQVANVPFQAPLNVPGTTGTDIAFTDDHAIVGNYLGFTIYDVKHPKKPKIVANVLCPGSQMDPSVKGDLLFLSVDSRRSDDSCTSTAQNDGSLPYWEGVRIFDISDKSNPRYIKSVETKCGSHTHTLVPDKAGEDVYIYVSSYAPSPSLPKCQPPHDLISIIKVPLDNPTESAVVSEPVLFPDGGNPGTPGNFPDRHTRATSGCHDITVYPAKDLAAGACMGDGVLWDISDPTNLREIERVQDENFAFWHSATFNNAGTKVIFTDELGGGGAATCNPEIGPERGADAIYDLTGSGDNRELEFGSYFKIDRTQTESENCVAHNGSLIPVPGKDIMVQSWYQGGVQVWDFTDSANPRKIGFWERGPLPNEGGGGTWSAYYYNGHIYSSDMRKGLDVLTINDPRTNRAKSVKMDEVNVQTQGSYPERKGSN